MLARSRGVRALHASAAYVARDVVRTAYGVRDSSGSNMQLDPRGVDYALFEAPSAEYRVPAADAGPADAPARAPDAALAPPTALLQRLLHAQQFDDALRALDQLEALDTPLGAPLVEYAHAARHCAARGHAADALRWLALAPHAAAARAGRWHVDQAVHWLTAAGDDALQRACVLAAAKGYASALTTGATHLFRTAAWHTDGARALWDRLTAPYAPAATAAALAPAPHAAPLSPERRAVDRRVKDALAADDLAHARAVLLRAPEPPSVEILAAFLAHAGRHTAVAVPRDPQRRGALATGRFLRPVRTAMQRHERALFDTALLRAREKEHDWHGALRVFQRRFQPVDGLEANTPSARAASHAAASLANSARRRAEARARRVRHLASPYAVACVLRALAALCAQDAALLQRLYVHCVRHLAPRHLSARVFEALIPAWSAAAPHAFVQPRDGAMWVMLRDMHAAHVEPRATTWTLLLQALVRDGSHASWSLVCALLERMGGSAARGADSLAGVALPPATPGMYAGVLQALHIAPGVRAERARQVRNLLRAARSRSLAAAAETHVPLQEQLARLESTEGC
ncbi:hypothetical protein MOBT1_001348 [Malassezia obtusa]|uniref:Uncharacterized protein n=1 Tax=Malassezia obtusa TaxID=76774 RepID=A0AAF0DZT8_9BASI|nr:hypothetical protein MOBT1_001348 [Malassezia obtusa]